VALKDEILSAKVALFSIIKLDNPSDVLHFVYTKN